MTQAVLECKGVIKRFGPVTAVDGIDLAGAAGEVLALLGPNGAGKTTLVDLLCGLRLPDQGSIRIAGHPPRTMPARQAIGLMPQNVGFPRHLKVKEILRLVAAHFADRLSEKDCRETFHLDDLMDRAAGNLSGGQMRRLALAVAFLGRPKVLFLDEPTTGLDVEARRSAWNAVRLIAERGTLVLLTTHYLEEAAKLATRVAVIKDGKILLEDTPEGVRGRLGMGRLRFRLPAEVAAPPEARQEGGQWVIDCDDSDAAVRDLVKAAVPFRDLEVGPASLEDAILALLGQR